MPKVLEWAKIFLTWILDIHRHFHPFDKKEKNEGFHLAVETIFPDQAWQMFIIITFTDLQLWRLKHILRYYNLIIHQAQIKG